MNSFAVELSRHQDRKPWLSGRVPDGFWDLRENRLWYLDWLGWHLGYADTEDWYRVCNSDFIRNHGGSLLWRIYNSSVYAAMLDYQQQYDWIPWLFSKTPKGFWHLAKNRRSYMEWLAGILQIENEDEWYRVTKASFDDNHGAGLLRNHYQGSILLALREFRPDYDWRPWLFPKVPHGFWKKPANRRRYLVWLARRLQLRSSSEWHCLTKQDLAATGGSGLFHGYYIGSMARLHEEVVSMRLGSASNDRNGSKR